MRRCFPVTFRLSYRKALSLSLNPLRASLLWVAFAFGAEARTVEGWQPSLAGFVDGLVTTTLDRDAVAGAVVVIVSEDKTILSKGYRLADARTGRLMSAEHDVIPLASVTKVFTAMAVLRLAQAGRLALDDPIYRHLPGLDLNQRFGDIAIRHLLSHSAGLEDRYWGYFGTREKAQGASALEQISAILPEQVRTPGEVISYSNASYVLLGEIVAQVTGKPFHEFVAETILSPMGIEDPFFMHEMRSMSKASPYHVWNEGRYAAADPAPWPAIHSPSGGSALSGQDMGRAMQMLLSHHRHQDGADAISITTAKMRMPAWPDRDGFSGRTLGYWTETWAGHILPFSEAPGING